MAFSCRTSGFKCKDSQIRTPATQEIASTIDKQGVMKLNFYIPKKKHKITKTQLSSKRKCVSYNEKKKSFQIFIKLRISISNIQIIHKLNVLIINNTIKLGCGAINNWQLWGKQDQDSVFLNSVEAATLNMLQQITQNSQLYCQNKLKFIGYKEEKQKIKFEKIRRWNKDLRGTRE